MIPANREKKHLSLEDQGVEWEEVRARLPGEQQEEDMETEPGDAREETPGTTKYSEHKL